MDDLILDGTKIEYYMDRVHAWERGERIAPITIDMALTRACNYRCVFCYSQLQENDQHKIKWHHAKRFLNDCADIGVRGISLVSDGESTLSPIYTQFIEYGHSLGLALASGTNAYALDQATLERIIPKLTYLRVNISAGEERRYQEIMGAPTGAFSRVLHNIEGMVGVKEKENLSCTVGMQMVLMPELADQVLPLTHLATSLGVDYLIIKHCSDDENGALGVDYDKYKNLSGLLKQAEGMSNSRTKIVVKWSKLHDGNTRQYSRCYGSPFIIQISGTGLVAPCGMLFNDRYKRYHIGNITETSFSDIWNSEKYRSVIKELASSSFNAQRDCGSLCLQHCTNKWLASYKSKGKPLVGVVGRMPKHKEFL